MPSGYTYHIYDGTDLNGRNFMLRCAKEFLPESRDGSLDDPIADEIHPDNYCSDQLQKDIEELKKFDQMTDKDIKEKLEKSYKNATRDYENRLDEIHKMRKNYEKVLAYVESWKTPSSKYDNLKNFVITQIKDSMDYDCHEPERPTINKSTVEEYKKVMREMLQKDIERDEETLEKEHKNYRDRNELVRILKESLPED